MRCSSPDGLSRDDVAQSRGRRCWSACAPRSPRVHCITNAVAQNFTANMLLAAGAVPSMTLSPEEIAAFVARSDALLVNLGTFDRERREATEIAVDDRRAKTTCPGCSIRCSSTARRRARLCARTDRARAQGGAAQPRRIFRAGRRPSRRRSRARRLCARHETRGRPVRRDRSGHRRRAHARRSPTAIR